jgi:galactoside O-acetyltransferase
VGDRAVSSSFLSEEEIQSLGLAGCGQEVRISKYARIYSPAQVTVGNNVRIDDFSILSGGKGICIGSNVHIGAHSALYGGAGIVLDDFSGISGRVSLYSVSDDYSGCTLTNATIPEEFRPRLCRGEIRLGRHAIVGAASTILPGVSVGEGCAIGAHSLVTKDCDPWMVYFGCPAKALRKRKRGLLASESEFLDWWSGERTPRS